MACWCIGHSTVTRHSSAQVPAILLLHSNLRQVFHTRASCQQTVQFCTGQGSVMPCGWEGNCRSDISLDMQCITDFSGLFPYRLTVYSTPTTLLMGYGTLCLFVISSDALQLSASTLQSEISRTVVLASRPL